MRHKRKSESKLIRKILKFKPIKDESGKRFVPFCSYGWHQGISKNYELCEERRCTHYHRLYII